MLINLEYVSKYGMDVGDQTAQDTYKLRTGNCLDMSIFAYHILTNNNYEAYIMFIQLSASSPKNHAICVFKDQGKIYTINNSHLTEGFDSYEAIAYKHDPEWWRYLLFNNMQSAAEFKNPILEVYREN